MLIYKDLGRRGLPRRRKPLRGKDLQRFGKNLGFEVDSLTETPLRKPVNNYQNSSQHKKLGHVYPRVKETPPPKGQGKQTKG